jgi:hypothetical protein
MDVQVTCPRCHERQALADPAGYTCARCGAQWRFVPCDSCGSRFHMRPGVTDWTCPECGVHHRTAARVPPPAATSSIALSGRTMLVGGAVVVIALAAVWFFYFRSSPAAAPGGHATPASTLQRLCSDVPFDFVARAGALGREETAVRGDAVALTQEGATKDAKGATTLADALGSLRQAVVANADTAAATLKVQRALAALPC